MGGMGKAHPCIFSKSDDTCAALDKKYCLDEGRCSFYKSSAEWEIATVVEDVFYKKHIAVRRKHL